MLSELLIEDVTIIKNVKCKETIWLRIKNLSGIDLYVGCVYMLTQDNIKHLCTDRFNFYRKMVACFSQKAEFCFWMILMPRCVKVKM